MDDQDDTALTELTVVGVRVELPSQQPIVLLKETAGDRYLPIWIGAVEATAIAFAQQGVVTQRPMIAIRREIDEAPEVLRGAPHTAASVLGELPYDRELAAFPAGVRPATKYWPPVGRIDGAYGDRNLVCACPPMEDYES